jgi:hypothetical protein
VRQCAALVAIWLISTGALISWWGSIGQQQDQQQQQPQRQPQLQPRDSGDESQVDLQFDQHVKHEAGIIDRIQRRDQVVVLGMHHSGTSVVTMLLNRTGLHTGWPGHLVMRKDNPFKYWELKAAVSLNQQVFNWRDATDALPGHAGPKSTRRGALSWIGRGFDLNKLSPEALESFGMEIDSIVNKLDNGIGRPWAVKDPRMSLMAGTWLSRMSAPVCVLVARDPVEMAVRFLGYNQVGMRGLY